MIRSVEKTERLCWVDNLKGYILLLVCLFHLHVPWLFVDTASRKMVTFFFLSGFLFSLKRYDSIKSYVYSKTKTLLHPYLCLSFLFALIDPETICNIIQMAKNGGLTFNELFLFYGRNLFLNGMNTIYGHSANSSFSLWFVWTLYLVSIVFFTFHYFLICKLKLKKCSYVVCCLSYIAVCFWCAHIIQTIQLNLPFNLMGFFSKSPYFVMGVVVKPLVMYLMRTKLWYLFFATVFFGVLSYYVPLREWNSIAYAMIRDISFIVCLFILFDRIHFLFLIEAVLRNFARNALVILPVHCFVFVLYKNVCIILFQCDYRYMIGLFLVLLSFFVSIPLFRNKLYFLLGKEKISVKESLRIDV